MADAADTGCVHLVRTIEHDEKWHVLQYICCDCGQVAASLTDDAAAQPGRLVAWAEFNAIPPIKLRSWLPAGYPR